MTSPINVKTVRELGGEIWSEITHRQNSHSENCLIGDIDFKTGQELTDLVMGVLARHSGSMVVNDEDTPVLPLETRH